MKMQGVVSRWDPDKGFGFIKSPQSSQDVFFHIREFSAPDRSMPQPGLSVEFETIHVGGKGPRGMAVCPVSAHAQRTQDRSPRHQMAGGRSSRHRPLRMDRPASGSKVFLPLMVVWAAAIVWATLRGLMPLWAIPVLSLINLLAFYLYWWDKYAVGKGHWRTSEATLQLWGLAGGWPAAWLAQQLLRHKSRKESFQSAYKACVGLHCIALAAWLLWAGSRAGILPAIPWF